MAAILLSDFIAGIVYEELWKRIKNSQITSGAVVLVDNPKKHYEELVNELKNMFRSEGYDVYVQQNPKSGGNLIGKMVDGELEHIDK